MRILSNSLLIGLMGLLSIPFSQAQTSNANTDEVILAKVRETELKHRVAESGTIIFTFGVEHERTQAVQIMGKVATSFSTDYMTVLSRVLLVDKGQFDKRVAYELLQKNWDYSSWFWQIKEEEIDGKTMVYVYLGASIPVNTAAVKLYRILNSLAQEADTVEKELTSDRDDF